MTKASSTFYLRALANLNTLSFSSLQILLFTLIPFLAEEMHLSLASVVAAFSFGSFLFLWSSPFWSAKSDRWGRQSVLLIGMLGLGLSTLLLVGLLKTSEATPLTWPLLILSRAIYGLFASAIVPVSQALQSDLSQEKSAMKAMMSNSMSLNLGRALGPAYILFSGGKNMTTVIYGCLFWIAFMILLNGFFFLISASRNQESAAHARTSWLQSIGSLQGIFTLAVLFTSFIGILNTSLAAILQKTFLLGSMDSSYLMAKLLLVSIVIALATQALSRLYFKNPWQGSLLIGNGALVAGSCFLKIMHTETELWIAISLLSVGIALIPPSYLSLMASLHDSNMGLGKRAGLLGAANTIGYAIGGGLTALVLKTDWMSLESLMLCMAFLIFANITVLYKNRPMETAV